MKEYTETMKRRYSGASRTQKGRLLDEFVEVTGYHRKSAVRALCGVGKNEVSRSRGRPAMYGGELKDALRVAWEASDRLCGKRLSPFAGELADRMVEHGELSVSNEVMGQLGSVSASTIDRLMRPYKHRGVRGAFSTTKPGSLLKEKIRYPSAPSPSGMRTDRGSSRLTLWRTAEIRLKGFYLNTLTAVDIATGWVECRAVWGKGQQRVGGAVDAAARLLPFPLLGLDSDNGSEFLNHHLYAYCQSRGVTFTRSRPYRKNDNAHVEQKNWSVVRRLIGYGRYASRDSFRQLARTYGLARQYVNYFQPVMKLKSKSRNGARVATARECARCTMKPRRHIRGCWSMMC